MIRIDLSEFQTQDDLSRLIGDFKTGSPGVLASKARENPFAVLLLDEIEKAKWWDDERTRLRIYWKTLKSFADDLFDYAFQFGYDMVTTFDIVKMKQSWSTLPPSDIRILMKLLVESKRASWADSAQKTIQFHYD